MFETKGEVAEWRLVYDHLTTLRMGDIVTYEFLTKLLGRDFLDAREPFYQANRRLLVTHRRGFENVPSVGYRMITAEEHEKMANKHHRRGRRQLKRSLSYIHNVDRTQLSPEALRRFDALEDNLARQVDFTRRLDSRVAKVEKALAQARDERPRVESEMEQRITERVERTIQDLVEKHFKVQPDV